MISPQFIFDRVAALSKKDKAGYMSAQEFTDDLNQAQEILMEYYYDRFEDSQKTVDSLQPFIKESNLPISNGFVAFPSDYRHRVEVSYNLTEKNCEGPPKLVKCPMPHLHINERSETLQSSVRRPSLKKKRFYHSYVNNKLQVFPSDLLGTVCFTYIIQPPEAKYAVTIDVFNDEENYDPINSIDLIWNAQDSEELVSIMLLFKGIQVRESALIQWVNEKQVISNNI
jgi:hypothetical protein